LKNTEIYPPYCKNCHAFLFIFEKKRNKKNMVLHLSYFCGEYLIVIVQIIQDELKAVLDM